jgi:hypothetical protein
MLQTSLEKELLGLGHCRAFYRYIGVAPEQLLAFVFKPGRTGAD